MAVEKGKLPPRKAKERAAARSRGEGTPQGLDVVNDDDDLPSRETETAVAKSKPHGDLLPGISAERLKSFDDLAGGQPPDVRLPAQGLGAASFGATGEAGSSGRRASFGVRAIFGRDDRTPVADTTVPPYCWVCDLELVSPNGTRLVGTGWLAGPRLVITAGHCVYCHEAEYGQGWMRKANIQVMPGHNGHTVLATSAVTQLMTTREWMDGASEEFDIGAILLKDPVGDDLGFFGFADYEDADLQAMNVNIAGYPADKGGDTMWQHANRIQQVLPQRLGYTIDTMGGDSGAPLIQSKDGTFTVVGIHNYGTSNSNYSTRINTAVFNQIKAWKEA